MNEEFITEQSLAADIDAEEDDIDAEEDDELDPVDIEAEADDIDSGPDIDTGVNLLEPGAIDAGESLEDGIVERQDRDSILIRVFDDILEEADSVKNPEGLVVLPNGNLLAIEGQSGKQNNSNEITTDQELVSSGVLPASIAPINTAVDPQSNRLLGLNPSGNKLIEVTLGAESNLNSDTSTEIDVKSFGIKNARGITVAADGTLYVLDGAAKQIVVIEPDAEGNFETAAISQVNLPTDVNNPRGIAVDPSSGNFQILSPAQNKLYELNQKGQLIATRDLSELGLKKPGSIVFAPSADSTDAPETQSLYVADENLGIVELSFEEPSSPQAATSSSQAVTLNEPLVLVQTIDSSQFSPPSPYPSGITYISSTDRLVISDGEINEEIGIPFEGANVWDITLSGGETGTGDTTAFSDEPTGIKFDPDFGTNGRFFISDDTGGSNTKGIYTLDPGNDGLPGGGDDNVLGFFNPTNFGVGDPEGVTFAVLDGQEVLFIADGVDNEVYRVTTGGQLISSFDTLGFGLSDPEGIDFDPDSGNLFLVSNPEESLFEVTTDGTLVNEYDISAANADNPAGVALGPSSNDPNSKSVYITDRGTDNNSDPNANDGKVYEFSLTPPEAGNEIFVSSSSSGSVGGVSFGDEDILLFEESTGTWQKYFDGNDVLSGDVDAFHIEDDGSILLSLTSSQTLPDVGTIDDSDIVRFIPTSLGNNTAGSFELFFDGSDVGLDTSSEDIDAIGFASDGRLSISTKGSPSVVSGARDEDLLIFNDSSFGETTSGTWELYFEGSDVLLGDGGGNEDLYGTWIDDDTDEIYLTTQGDFTVSGGVSGDEADIFAFDPTSLGSTTSGSFSSFFDGSANGFGGEIIDGFYLDLV